MLVKEKKCRLGYPLPFSRINTPTQILLGKNIPALNLNKSQGIIPQCHNINLSGRAVKIPGEYLIPPVLKEYRGTLLPFTTLSVYSITSFFIFCHLFHIN